MPKAKILLVEDDAFLAELYVTKFSELDYDITVAEDGEQGLAEAKKIKPGCILLDIVLPRMDGLALLKMLKETDGVKDIPVILLTNLGQKEDVELGLGLGAAAYVIKAHFTPTEVVAKVEEVLKKKSAA